MFKILHEGNLQDFNGKSVLEVAEFLTQVEKSLRFMDKYKGVDIKFGINEGVEEFFFYVKKEEEKSCSLTV